jgi:hypothetical protein
MGLFYRSSGSGSSSQTAFGVDAGSFLLSAGLLATLPRRPRASAARPPVRTAIAEGLRWLRRHRLLCTLAGLLAVNTFCFQLGNVTVILLATQTLHVSDRGYGLLLAALPVLITAMRSANAERISSRRRSPGCQKQKSARAQERTDR